MARRPLRYIPILWQRPTTGLHCGRFFLGPHLSSITQSLGRLGSDASEHTKTVRISVLLNISHNFSLTSRLDIFFAHRHQCGFDVHVDRFRASMSSPPAQQPHPALLDAIYLMACYFSQPHYAAQEQHYLQRALSGISSSLQDSDRLIQIVQASCLIAIYFFSRGRTLEGYYHSSTAARLAVSLGLHQIKSDDWYNPQFDLGSSAAIPQPAFLTFKSSLQLPAPRDSTEYSERVAAFWQVFSVDRAWSVASGLPAALPDDDNSPRARVETTWPSSIGDSQPLNDSSKLNPYLRAKVVTLFERSYRLASSASKRRSPPRSPD